MRVLGRVCIASKLGRQAANQRCLNKLVEESETMDIYGPLHLSPREKLIRTLEAWEEEIATLSSEELDQRLAEEGVRLDAVKTLTRYVEHLVRKEREEKQVEEEPTMADYRFMDRP